jgi:transposase
MSTTTKSPKKVARAAFKIAKSTLPQYAHRYSPQKFTQPQLFVCLVLKIFFKTDYRGIVAILKDSDDLCKCFNLKTVPHFTTLQKASKRLLRLNVTNDLLRSTVKTSKIKLAAIDSTGLDAGYISRYFVRRRRSKRFNLWEDTIYKRWPKLAVVCDCQNHLILSAITTRGPNVDINQFCKTLKPAAEQYSIKHLLADAGYDSEANHRYAREVHQIKTTIPPKHGRPLLTKKPLSGKYREQMRTNFDKETYGQRWQVETVFSMIKRNFGSAVRARTYWSQCREMMLFVLTHNIAIILLVKELFYRAKRTHFFLHQNRSKSLLDSWLLFTGDG